MTQMPSHLRLIRGSDGLVRLTWHEERAEDPGAAGPARALRRRSPKAGRVRGRDLLMPWEVATIFRVDAKTVSRWARTGRLNALRTPGGHHRFDREEVLALLRARNADTVEDPMERELSRATE